MPGIGQIIGLAGDKARETRTGEPSAFPSNAKECDSVRAGTKSVCKSIVFNSTESQTGGSASTQRERFAQVVFKNNFPWLSSFISPQLSYHRRSDAVGRIDQML